MRKRGGPAKEPRARVSFTTQLRDCFGSVSPTSILPKSAG